MRPFLTSTLVIISTFAFGYWIYTSIDSDFKNRPLRNTDILREKILASITNPFPQADTFILDTQWDLCGSSKPEEIPVVFETYIDSSAFENRLRNTIHLPVVTMIEFHKVMDTVRKYRFNGEYPPNLWDSCRIGKVSAGIAAEKITSTKVRLYESYIYNDKAKTIQKDFVFKDNDWILNVIDTTR
jgi:hypothetical protein